MLKKGQFILSGAVDSVRNLFGKIELYCKTTKLFAEL